MAVMLETSKGDIVIDLFYEQCPVTCRNFIWLCKIKYYNNCLFHYVQRNFLIQSGDPTGTGKGGESIYGQMYGSQARFFDDEIDPKMKHKSKGVVGMASPAENTNASQFYITSGDSLDSLDEKHTIFGEVGEGLDVVLQINNLPTDNSGRPLMNVRIWHTHILYDPWEDQPQPPQLQDLIPPQSPPPVIEAGDYLEEDWKPKDDDRPVEVIEEEIDKREALNRAVQLELVGDIPEAEVKPPSNMLFICKLNPVTTEEDLEIIFSRFGNITSCDVIRDWKTGDSLCYAFIGFDNEKSSEEAYFKMNNCIIDDRRIKVDFSQSVYTIWRQFRKFGKKGGGRGGAEAQEELQQVEKGNTRRENQRNPQSRNTSRRQYDLLLNPSEDDPKNSKKERRRDDERRSRGDESGRRRERRRSRSPRKYRDDHRSQSPPYRRQRGDRSPMRSSRYNENNRSHRRRERD